MAGCGSRASAILTLACSPSGGRDHPELAYYQSYEQFLAQANVDAVVLSTPLQLHAPQALQALAAGKHVLSEVIAATTLDECWALVAAVQRSGLKYMFAENSCYRRENMLVLNMVEQGLFGEIICAEGGYIHDCTHLMYFPIGDYGQDRAGEPTWRGRILQQYNGSWYPHPLPRAGGRSGSASTATTAWSRPLRTCRTAP